jgi:hypothetical protein
MLNWTEVQLYKIIRSFGTEKKRAFGSSYIVGLDFSPV